MLRESGGFLCWHSVDIQGTFAQTFISYSLCFGIPSLSQAITSFLLMLESPESPHASRKIANDCLGVPATV